MGRGEETETDTRKTETPDEQGQGAKMSKTDRDWHKQDRNSRLSGTGRGEKKSRTDKRQTQARQKLQMDRYGAGWKGDQDGQRRTQTRLNARTSLKVSHLKFINCRHAAEWYCASHYKLKQNTTRQQLKWHHAVAHRSWRHRENEHWTEWEIKRQGDKAEDGARQRGSRMKTVTETINVMEKHIGKKSENKVVYIYMYIYIHVHNYTTFTTAPHPHPTLFPQTKRVHCNTETEMLQWNKLKMITPMEPLAPQIFTAEKEEKEINAWSNKPTTKWIQTHADDIFSAKVRNSVWTQIRMLKEKVRAFSPTD